MTGVFIQGCFGLFLGRPWQVGGREREAGREMWHITGGDQCGNGDVRGKGGPAEPRDAVEWGKEQLGFEPDREQAQVLGSASKRGLLNCTRQWGKSTIAAAKAVYQACTCASSWIQ